MIRSEVKRYEALLAFGSHVQESFNGHLDAQLDIEILFVRPLFFPSLVMLPHVLFGQILFKIFQEELGYLERVVVSRAVDQVVPILVYQLHQVHGLLAIEVIQKGN
jgi:hypothetical protein